MMSSTGKEDKIPPKFDEEGNLINVDENSKSGASNASTLEDLMRKLEKLTAKNQRIRAKAKGKKTKGNYSSRRRKLLV
jgi:hypothetical protein